MDFDNPSNAKKMTNIEYFAKSARYNSGRHFLDSGGSNGRHWQNPIDPKEIPFVIVDRYGPCINTAKFLEDFFTVDKELQEQFDSWAQLPENKDSPWFELGPAFCEEVLGLEQRGRDNTYNAESDLSQQYLYEVYSGEESRVDCVFATDDTLVLIYIHTGADVRGGYSYPLFCRPRGEYSFPIDLCAEFVAIEARRTDADCSDIHQEWMCGYHSYPFAQVEDDAKRMFFRPEREPNEFIVELEDGALVKVAAVHRECY